MKGKPIICSQKKLDRNFISQLVCTEKAMGSYLKVRTQFVKCIKVFKVVAVGSAQELRADLLHPCDYPHTPTDYRHTDRWMDGTKYIISLLRDNLV